MKTIREMLGYEGLPEWDAEFEEPVDLDWTGAASIFSSEDGKESGGMGATFDDLWARYVSRPSFCSPVTFNKLGSIGDVSIFGDSV
jgi:hypothetical protein